MALFPLIQCMPKYWAVLNVMYCNILFAIFINIHFEKHTSLDKSRAIFNGSGNFDILYCQTIYRVCSKLICSSLVPAQGALKPISMSQPLSLSSTSFLGHSSLTKQKVHQVAKLVKLCVCRSKIKTKLFASLIRLCRPFSFIFFYNHLRIRI